MEEFIKDLREIIIEAEDLGTDMSRVAVVQEIQVNSGKKISRADFEVAVNPSAGAVIVQRKIDPNESHPYLLRELLVRVNKKRKDGYELNTHDVTVLAWKYALRENQKYVWRNKHTNQSF